MSEDYVLISHRMLDRVSVVGVLIIALFVRFAEIQSGVFVCLVFELSFDSENSKSASSVSAWW